MTSAGRIALKVDCDTFEGTRVGLPNLIRLFDRLGIRASFFFTLGPDTSGRAIARIFTQKGFLKKMLRSRAVSLYGPRTVLYGTLLPSPMIGEKLKDDIRAVAAAGHEVGVHGWDHIRWHDRLDRLSEEQIDRDYRRAHDAFEAIFGFRARASAAPGWHATPGSLAVQEKFDLLYASNTRGGAPFFPVGDRPFRTLEIPTTLPTWDEAMADPAYQGPDALVSDYRRAVTGTEVHTIHTEIEATAYLGLFERMLTAWKADGHAFVPMKDIAAEALARRDTIPQERIARVEIPNRTGFVSARAHAQPASH